MKKKLLLFLLVFFLLAGLTLVSGCKKKDKAAGLGTGNEAMESDDNQDDDGEESFFGSINDLIKKGKPLMCTTKGEDEGVKVDNVTYIDGKKARHISQIEEEGEKFETNMITDDKTVWMWTDTTPGEGMKMTIEMSDEEIEEFNNDAEMKAEEQEVMKKYDFKCKKWRVDKSVFDLPKNINFKDMNAMMNEMKAEMGASMDGLDLEAMEEPRPSVSDTESIGSAESMDEVKEMLCGMCDDAPDMEECRAGLDCE